MNRLLICVITIFFISGVISCKKEYSLENKIKASALGSLQDDGTGECLPKDVGGTFIAGTSLGDTNYIQVSVDVDSAGPYTITTNTVNGYTFTASGDFANAGINVVKLKANGKPLTEGVDVFTVSFDSTTCTVPIVVLASGSTGGGTALGTLSGEPSGCTSAMVNGDFAEGTAVGAGNTVQVQVNVTTVGNYTISTNTVNGYGFSKTGVFSTTGVQNVTLTATGTPIAAGTDNFTVTFGSSSCTFPVTVNTAASGGGANPPPVGTYFWKFSVGTEVHQGAISPNAQIQTTNAGSIVFTAFSFTGSVPTSDTTIVFTIADINGGINANENYNSTSLTTNSAGITIGLGVLSYDANPQVAGSNVTVKVTSINTSTKVIAGTFSGTLKSSNGETLTIANGEFNVNYQ